MPSDGPVVHPAVLLPVSFPYVVFITQASHIGWQGPWEFYLCVWSDDQCGDFCSIGARVPIAANTTICR